MTIRILHVVANFTEQEAMGRSSVELARRVPEAESFLCTNEARSRTPHFAGVHEVGGSKSFFHFTRARGLLRVVRSIQPDIIHLHGGSLTPFLARSPAFRAPVVLSIYVWARLPGVASMGGSSYRDMRRGQILRAGVILSTMVPHRAAKILLKGKRIRGVLTPDPAVAAAIEGLTRIPVRLAPGGAEVDGLRAFRDGAVPVIAFAGSAQMVRGIDTLIEAMPRVQRIFPGAKLRLLLLPSLQLEEIVKMVRRSPVADSIELTTEPVADLRPELARCTVAAFPFKFDHATLAPPLTVAQAMSVGLPVIGTSVACISPILDSGYNGLQVPVHDPVALADAICRVLSSDGTWERLSKGAIATIARDWNWEKAAGAAAGLYEEVLDSRARREI